MSRIPYRDPATCPPEMKARLEKLGPLNVFRMLAHSDAGLQGFVRMGNALLYKGELDPHLREMAILRVGHLSKAGYEVFQHERIAARLGLAPAKIAATKSGPDTPGLSETEALVLRLTDDIVRNVKADEALFRAAEARLTRGALVELVLAIGYYMMVSRFLETFEVDLEPAG